MRKWKRKGSEKEAKREPKGSQRAPKVSQRVPKGSQGEPKGNQREPKVSKGRLAHLVEMGPKMEPFSIKIDEKIDAKIDAEKVMKIDEQSMRKWSEIDGTSI